MPDLLRIGTRTSKLALWQAEQVGKALRALGYTVERVTLESQGDLQTEIPLDTFGKPGVFTDRFDEALAREEIDLAVHSLKDYPATIPGPFTIGAHLRRDSPLDTLVLRKPVERLHPDSGYIIATCSSRRKAQWLGRFPQSTMTSLRGNVPTRLAKLYESNWDGAIFARAGLNRLGIRPPHAIDLGWMIPAPAQGIIAAVCRENDTRVTEALAQIDHAPTGYIASIERAFLEAMGGGCEAPIGALATLVDNQVHFKGYVLHEGKEYTLEMTVERKSSHALAALFADRIKSNIAAASPATKHP